LRPDVSATCRYNYGAKISLTFGHVKSYRLTVLVAARSLAVWVAPNAYQMTTELGRKRVNAVIIGSDYWTLADCKRKHSGRVSSNLDADIVGLVRNAEADASAPFARLLDQTQDGKCVGAFGYISRTAPKKRFAVAAFRAETARFGNPERVAALVDELSESSPEFSAIWRDYNVANYGEGVKRLQHPAAGLVTLEYSSFAVDGRPDLGLLIYTPATAADREHVRAIIAAGAKQNGVSRHHVTLVAAHLLA